MLRAHVSCSPIANSTDSSRTAQAGLGLGRQPKRKIDLSDIRPLYETDNKGNLIPSAELLSLAVKMGVEYQVTSNPATGQGTDC
eukprot:scaffold62755_cov35-Tisochrysis_lutea.AAC.5